MQFLNIKITPNNRYDNISPMSSLSSKRYTKPRNINISPMSSLSSKKYTKPINRYNYRIPYPINIVNITLKLNKLKVNRNVR